jgi:hypothetical protein
VACVCCRHQVNVDAKIVGWYRTLQLGHFTESGSKAELQSFRTQRTLFDVPPALQVGTHAQSSGQAGPIDTHRGLRAFVVLSPAMTGSPAKKRGGWRG